MTGREDQCIGSLSTSARLLHNAVCFRLQSQSLVMGVTSKVVSL